MAGVWYTIHIHVLFVLCHRQWYHFHFSIFIMIRCKIVHCTSEPLEWLAFNTNKYIRTHIYIYKFISTVAWNPLYNSSDGGGKGNETFLIWIYFICFYILQYYPFFANGWIKVSIFYDIISNVKAFLFLEITTDCCYIRGFSHCAALALILYTCMLHFFYTLTHGSVNNADGKRESESERMGDWVHKYFNSDVCTHAQ